MPVLKEFICTKRTKSSKEPFHYDVKLEEYDLFDDYLEMIIQFGVGHMINGYSWAELRQWIGDGMKWILIWLSAWGL